MDIDFNGVNIHVHGEYDSGPEARPPLIFLHGFTLSGQEWLPFFPKFRQNFQPLAIDIIGHGKSGAPSNNDMYSFELVISQIKAILDHLDIKSSAWVGYSMGGRLLLHFAKALPEYVNVLILESTTPGIRAEKTRLERKQADKQLARFIERNPIDKFVSRWTRHPIFRSQRQIEPDRREYVRNIRLQNSPIGLANNLRGLGRGSMTPVWNSLPTFDFPVLLLSGELDQKHVSIQKEMHVLLPESTMEIIYGAGHNVHFEKPSEYAALVNRFLSEKM